MKENKKLLTKNNIKDFLIINFGLILMALGYGIFVDPNNLIIGGVGGIATLLKEVMGEITILGFHIKSSFIILVLNVILLIIALLFVNKSFFIKTIYTSIAYPFYIFLLEIILDLFGNTFINITEVVKELTESGLFSPSTIKIMTSGAYIVYIIFGAVLSGIGIGLVLKKGSSTGGVDILQQICLQYLKIPFSISLIIIDGLIVVLSAIYFNDIFIILYGIIFILISGFILDSVTFNGFNSRTVNIITKEPELVKQKIYDLIDRGVTELYAKGGYYGKDFKLLICVMSNKEFYKIKEEVLKIDERAFIYVARSSEVHGEGFTYPGDSDE